MTRSPLLSKPLRSLSAIASLFLAAAGCSPGEPAEAPPPAEPVSTRAQELDVLLAGTAEYPQYIAVRKANTERYEPQHNRPECTYYYGNARTCVIMTLAIVDGIPDATQRRNTLAFGFREIRNKVLGASAETAGRRLATMVMLDTLNVTVANQGKLETLLEDLFAAAQQERMPLLVNLDTVNWWDARSDLWTNPQNVEANVSMTPVQLGWRNWETQLRVKPAPNLASADFRAANQQVLLKLLPRLKAYYERLPPGDKYLYGGLVFGTEISVGVNNYFYPNGNAFAGTTGGTGCDPGELRSGCTNATGYPPNPLPSGPCKDYNYNQCPPNFAASTSGGVEQIGYKAASTLGLLTPQQPTVNRQVLDDIVVNYLGFLNHLTWYTGVPSHKVFAHVGGNFGASGPHSLGIGRYSALVPGWSMYGGDASGTGVRSYLSPYIESTADTRALPWGSPEWLAYFGGEPRTSWTSAIESTATYYNNRLVTVANWEGISARTEALAGIKQALVAPSSSYCHLSPSLDVGHADFTVSGASAGTGLRILTSGAEATYLLVSTTNTLNPDGTLANANQVNTAVTGQGSYIIGLGSSTRVYGQLVADGCTGSPGGRKRVMSPVRPIDVVARQTTAAVPFPRVFSRVEGGNTTLSWDIGSLGAGSHAVYLNVSTDATFSTINVINTAVTGGTMYTRTGLAAGTYYARVVVDNPTRYISNTLKVVVP